MSVWIDQRGIEAAKSWSGEIVDAIERCKAFLILLSSHSMESENVAKELSIAFENKCKLLPVVIEDVPLARDFKYPLAGVQRVAYTQFDSIRSALSSIGVKSTTKAKARDQRKSLMLLPFEDLSPTRDNEWFTDGIASEMISSLSRIKSLRMIDWNTSKLFKDRHAKTIQLAQELDVRYFIEGQVRKFGDQIKVAVTLFDVESGDYLWQDSLKGSMEDIFNIQENVTTSVIEGLKLHIEASELASVNARQTRDPQAYEYFLRGHSYAKLQTRQAFRMADKFLKQATAIDPAYAEAWMVRAHVLNILYKYDRDQAELSDAILCAQQALAIQPHYTKAASALSTSYELQGDLSKAEALLIESVEMDSNDYYAHYSLGQFYSKVGPLEKSIASYEQALQLKPDFLGAHWGIVLSSIRTDQTERAAQLAARALPAYEKALRISPAREGALIHYAALLQIANRPAEALEKVNELIAQPDLDAQTLYAAACLFSRLGEIEKALTSLNRGIDAGFKDLEMIRRDSDLNCLRDAPQYQAIIERLESKLHV
jgi:TolB-like protein